MELDPRMVLSVAFSAMLMAVVFHFQARSFPMSIQGIRRWSQAHAAISAAGLLLAARSVLPDFFSAFLGMLLLQVGVLGLYVGLCEFKDQKPNFWLWGVPVGIHLIGSVWFGYIDPLLWVRVALTAVTNICLLTPFLLLLLRKPEAAQSRWRVSSLFTALFVLGMMAVAAMRGGWALWFMPTQAPLSAAAINSVLTLVFPTVVVAFSMGLVLMAFDRLKSELEYLVSHDVLTSAYSRRGFLQLAEVEVSRAHRTQRDVALLMVDLDRFKLINDHYGHPVGDLVLKKFVEVTRQCLRLEDMLGRYGGEEFMILLPDTSPTAARVVAERIRVAVSATRMTLGIRNIRFTVSVGIANVAEGVSLEQLMKSADSAVYLAKARGRNRVEVAV